MRFVDLLRLSFSAMAQQKVRTILTTLGVLFGSCVLVLSLSLGQGVQETVEREYQRYAEILHVEVQPGWSSSKEKPPPEKLKLPDTLSPERKRRLVKEIIRRWQEEHEGRPVAIDRDVLKRLAAIPHVRAVKPLISQYGQVVHGKHVTSAMTLSVPPDEESLRSRIILGRMYDANDSQAVVVSEHLLYRLGIIEDDDLNKAIGMKLRLEVRTLGVSPASLLSLLGVSMAKVTGKEEKILRKIVEELPKAVLTMDLSKEEKAALLEMLNNKPEEPVREQKTIEQEVTVVGIFRAMEVGEGQRRWGWLYRRVDMAMVPEAAIDLYFRLPRSQKQGVDRVVLVADHVDHVEGITEAVDELNLSSRSLLELIEREQFTYLLIFACMTMIAVIALLVSALGITNTMFMSVLERVREIGIMKAVGARDGHIQMVFLIEGAIIGLVGGLVGLGLIYLLSFPGDAWTRSMVQERLSVRLEESIFVFPLWLTMGTPLFACLITTLAAYFPARRASKVNPVTALRHE